MAMKIDNDISSRVRNRITEVDKEKQAREAARAKTEPIPVNKVTTPVTPKKVTPLPQNVQNGFNIITSQIAQNTQNYQKYGTPINRNNIVPETPTRIVTAYDKNGNQVETKQPETYYNPNKALLKKDETGKNALEKAAEDKEFAEKHTTLGIGKDKKSYIPQALSAGTWSASNALINAPRVIGDVFETLNNKFVSPNLKTDNPDAFVKVPSQESIKAARSDYETIRNYYGQHAEEAQNTLMRMTANSQAQQQIANLVQSVPEMAAIAAVSYMSGGLAGATLGADLIGGTLATGAVVDNTISGMIGRIIKQYANNPTFWSSMATQAAHVSEDAKAAGADPFTALTATALIGPLNAAIETAGGIGSGEDDLLKILTKGQLAKATLNTALEEGLEEVKQGGVQELVFQALGINPVKPFTNELERKLGIPQRGINAYASTEAYDAANETPAVIDPSRMAQEFAGGFLMGGPMSLPGHAVNYQVNKNGPQPIPVNVPGARYEATENGFGTNGSNPLAKENLRTTKVKEVKRAENEEYRKMSDEELQSALEDSVEGYRYYEFGPDNQTERQAQLAEKYNSQVKDIRAEIEYRQSKSNTPQPIPVNQQIQQNYDQTGNIREALQGVENKPQNVPYAFDLNNPEERIKYKLTDEKTEKAITFMERVFGKKIVFDNTVKGKGQIDKDTGEIILNPKSIQNKSITRVVLGHEFTHSLENTSAYKALTNVLKNYVTSDLMNSYGMDKLKEKYASDINGLSDRAARKYIKEALWEEQYNKFREDYADEIAGFTEEQAKKYLEQEYVAEMMGEALFTKDHVIDRLFREDYSTFQTVKNWISDTLDKIRNEIALIKNRNNPEARELYELEKFMTNALSLYDKAARQSVKSNNQSNAVKYSKEVDDNGEEYVLLEGDIFDGKLDNESQSKYIMDYIATNIGDIYNIVSDGTAVYIGKDLPAEYYYSKSSQFNRNYRKKLDSAKLQAAQDIREIVEIAKGRVFEPNTKTKHNTDAKYGFYKYSSKFGVKNKTGTSAKIYDCTLIIRNDADGKSYLYDILVNKKVGRHDLAQASQESTDHIEDTSSMTLPTNNSVTPSGEKDNSVSTNNGRKSKGSGINAQTEEEASLYNKLNQSNGISFNQNTDNKGRTLSAGQKQYFQYAKTRDASGNLKTYYHGSPNEFDTFDIKKARSNGTYGKGFYFSESDSHAGQYGKQMEVYLNITNPVQNDTNAITKEQLRDFIQELADNEDDYGIDNYGYDATVDSVLDSVWGKTDFQMLLDLNASCVGNMVEAVKLFNEVNGTDYDGIIAPTETVAFYPEQIKQVTNQNPTTNPNTKLSKGAGIEAQSEEETNLYNKLKNGSDISLKGKALDNAYEKAVKDGNSDTAKMLVEHAAKNNGYDSPRLYHGSPKFGFTEFDLSAMDDGNSIFTTVNRRVAESYSGETSRSKISAGIKKDFWDMDTDEILSYVNEHIDSGYRKATVEEVNADIDRKMQPVREAVNKIDNFLAEKELTAEEEKIIKRIRNSCETFSNTTDNDEAFGLTSRVNDGFFDLMWENEDLKFELMDAMNYSEVSNAMTDLCQIIDTNAENDLFTKDGTNLEWEAKFRQELNAKLKPGVYELYGDLDRMLEVDAKGANWNEISTDFDDYFNAIMPFAKTRDICNYARQKGYEGVIIKNVKDSGGAVQGAHVPDDVYVFFYPSKVKSADVETYDDNGKLIPLSERFNYKNKDLRYSKGNSLEANTSEEEKLYSKLAGEAKTKKKFTGKGKVEAAKELVAVHNINGSDLVKSFELGGLPMPSIAILKANQGHSLFGNISLVFDKDTIDPKANKDNKIYSGDAYTPTFPQVSVRVNPEKAKQISEWATDTLEKVPSFSQGALNNLRYDVEDTIDRAGGTENYIENMLHDADMKQVYLADTGQDTIPMQTRQVEVKRSDKATYWNQFVIEDLGEEFMKEYDSIPTEQERKLFVDNNWERIEDVMRKDLAEVYGENSMIVRNITPERLRNKVEHIYTYWKKGDEPEYRTENDYAGTRKLIEDTVDMDDYRSWLAEKFGNIVDKKGIRNDKELFTPSGNRRSWEQLHYELNLENVVKAMKAENDQGIGGLGMQSIFGGSAESLGSIDEVRNRSGQLQIIPEEEYEAMRKDFSGRFFELTHDIVKHKDSFTAADEAANTFIDGLIKYKTKSAMNNYYKREFNGWANYDEYALDDFLEIVDGIRQMPTGYFEAKPKRAVSFGEAKAAIVPSDINPELVSKLEEYGTEVHMYEPGNEEQRRNILNSLDALKFRKAEGITADTDEEAKLYDKLKNYDPEKKWWTTINKPQAIPNNRPTENVAPEEETAANVPESVETTPKNVAEVPETRRAQDYTRRSAKQFMNQLRDDLHINRWANSKQLKAYTDEIVDKLKTGSLTEADKNRLFMDILAEGEMLNQNKVDE